MKSVPRTTKEQRETWPRKRHRQPIILQERIRLLCMDVDNLLEYIGEQDDVSRKRSLRISQLEAAAQKNA